MSKKLYSLVVKNKKYATQAIGRTILGPKQTAVVRFHGVKQVKDALRVEKRGGVKILSELPDDLVEELNLGNKPEEGDEPVETEPVETEPTEPVETEPTEPVETEPTEPVETEPTEPVETEPTEPVETEPTEPVETEPTEPVETEPTEPVETEPTEPVETEPTEPVETEPTEPVETEPTEPVETEPLGDQPVNVLSREELVSKSAKELRTYMKENDIELAAVNSRSNAREVTSALIEHFEYEPLADEEKV